MNQELKDLIEKLKVKAYESWPGSTGDERAAVVENLLLKVLPNWSAVLGVSEFDILTAVEANRQINVPNHYQAANFPMLDEVAVFDNAQGFKDMHQDLGFRCPSCGGVSTDPQACNADPEKCNWKSYGFFKCIGKGYRFAVKEYFLEEPKVYEIFMPIAVEGVQA